MNIDRKVLRYRMAIRATDRNPENPRHVDSVELLAGIWPGTLHPILRGKAPLDQHTAGLLDRWLELTPRGQRFVAQNRAFDRIRHLTRP